MKFPESRMQMKLVSELKIRYPWMMFWHTPNGGRRSFLDGVRFRNMGTRKGVADLVFLRGAHGYHGLLVELKYGRGALSEDQLYFESVCIDEGYLYICSNSIPDVMEIVRWYYELSD